jgi:hypothetical protein
MVAQRLSASLESAVANIETEGIHTSPPAGAVSVEQTVDALFLTSAVQPLLIGLHSSVPIVDAILGQIVSGLAARLSAVGGNDLGVFFRLSVMLSTHFHEGYRDVSAVISKLCADVMEEGAAGHWTSDMLTGRDKSEFAKLNKCCRDIHGNNKAGKWERLTAQFLGELYSHFELALLLHLVGIPAGSRSLPKLPRMSPSQSCLRLYLCVQLIYAYLTQAGSSTEIRTQSNKSTLPSDFQEKTYFETHLVLGMTFYGRMPWLLQTLLGKRATLMHRRMVAYWAVVGTQGYDTDVHAELYRECGICIAIGNLAAPSDCLFPDGFVESITKHVDLYVGRAWSLEHAPVGASKSVVSNFQSVQSHYDDLHNCWLMLALRSIIGLCTQSLSDTVPFPLVGGEPVDFSFTDDGKPSRPVAVRSLDVRPRHVPLGFTVIRGIFAGLQHDLDLLLRTCENDTGALRAESGYDCWVHSSDKPEAGGAYLQSTVTVAFDWCQVWRPSVTNILRKHYDKGMYHLLPEALAASMARVVRLASLAHGVHARELEFIRTRVGGYPQEWHADSFEHMGAAFVGLSRPLKSDTEAVSTTEFLNYDFIECRRLPQFVDVPVQFQAVGIKAVENVGPRSQDCTETDIVRATATRTDMNCSITSHAHRGPGNMNGESDRFTMFMSFPCQGHDRWTDEDVVYFENYAPDSHLGARHMADWTRKNPSDYGSALLARARRLARLRTNPGAQMN